MATSQHDKDDHTRARNHEPEHQEPSEDHHPEPPAIISPPYWRTISARTRSHSSAVGQISLVDNTDDASQVKACWAHSARIKDYSIVAGNLGKLDSYVVYNCEIETANGGKISISRRYNDFQTFHHNLSLTFPNSHASIPDLPLKSLKKFDEQFLRHRKEKLEYFLHAVVLNPEFSASPILKEFLFSNPR